MGTSQREIKRDPLPNITLLVFFFNFRGFCEYTSILKKHRCHMTKMTYDEINQSEGVYSASRNNQYEGTKHTLVVH